MKMFTRLIEDESKCTCDPYFSAGCDCGEGGCGCSCCVTCNMCEHCREEKDDENQVQP
ncbi:hypothetical protein [Delftia phage PhiW-14]|uniref:Metallothionein n=1 Tax=Delftia phage PhiW-14 TaxID=665032 RepID=C9DGC4_BPW14|nr:hypothetical protein DP-phiW-14_gp154 [Delftia phage PhiW-14]ACV50175.1 hypothetical protein [Delftia phage PhiW-14]